MGKTAKIAHQLWFTVGAVVILMLLAMGLIGRHVIAQQAQDDAMTTELGSRLDTATRWMGYFDGAIEAAERAVAEVLSG